MDKNFAKYILEKTKKDYNLIAKEFSEKRKEIWEELKFLFDNLKEGEKVLDLGCANSRWYPLFKEKKVDYFGLDSSENLIEIARKNFPEAKFFVGDALNLPFSDSFFDKVYAIALFHHIPSVEFRLKFLKEAKRVLKPKGNLIITVWRFFQKKEIFRLLKYTIFKILGISKLDFKDFFEPWGKKVMRYYHAFSKKELENLLRKAGFEILESGIAKNKKGNRQNYYFVCQKPL
jgi:ubiquinone/menaquinone biosynthesis C-methylase UbiE